MGAKTPDPVEQDQLRVITRVAWLYHVRGLKQSQVADQLGLSQSRVSRLLDEAATLGIVRTVVRVPSGIQLELEQALQEAYGLAEARVFEVPDGAEASLRHDLGRALGLYLAENPLEGDVIGLTSWSRTLREAIRDLEPTAARGSRYVVEMLGDVGAPDAQHEAALVTQQLARLAGAEPRFLRVPGVVNSVEVRKTLLEHDTHAREALDLLNRVDEALVGIGSCQIDPPLRAGDNFFTEEQFERAKALGAVGQLNLRFIDAEGNAVISELDDLVIGITLEQLRNCRRSIVVGGGASKYDAIRAALLGRWINTLVTDVSTAKQLIEAAS